MEIGEGQSQITTSPPPPLAIKISPVITSICCIIAKAEEAEASLYD